MAITDVRTKINTILTEDAKKAKKKPKDPHKKTRQGAPEATAPVGDGVCESEVFEEVTMSQNLTPMANELLGLLRQLMDQGQFQVLTLDVVDKIKAAHPDKGGEIDAAFEELKANGLITVKDGGISTAADTEEHPINEFFKRGKAEPEDLTDQPIVSSVDGRPGLALVDDGTEVAVRWDGEQRIQWVPRELVEPPGAMETHSYIGNTGRIDSMMDMLRNSKAKYSRRDFSHGGEDFTKYEITAPGHMHTGFHREFNKLNNEHPNHFYRESVELTEAGIKLAIESLTLVPKS